MWSAGDPIVRREVWRGRPVGAWAGIVVQDDDELLALWMPAGSPLAMTDDLPGLSLEPAAGRLERRQRGVTVSGTVTQA